MKFALVELKIGLVKLVKNFEIFAGPNTPEKLDFDEGSVRVPKNGINAIFTKRIAN